MTAQVRPHVIPALVLMTAWLGATAGCRQAAVPFTADHFDTSIEVQPDGSALVDEQIRGQFTGDATSFTRTVAGDEVDGVSLVSASLDGRQVYAHGQAGPDADVTEGRTLRVRWHVDATPGASHTFALQYRASNVVAIATDVDGRGSITWPTLPRARTYPIVASRVSLTVPSQSQVFEGTAGMTEAGWSVTRQPHGIVATRDGIGLDQGTAVASFSIDPSVIHMSDWQVTADLRSEFAAAFVSAALFVVVVGWGALWWILRFQFPAIRVSPQEAASDEAEDLPPATAMALVRPGSEAGRGAELGTLFALAREGRIAASEGRLVATPTAQPPAWAHERLVLDLVARRASEPEIGRGLSSDLASARRAFRRAVAEDLTAHALLEPERVTVASGLRTTGWLGLVFGALCAVVAWLTLGRFGFWPQLFSGSLLLVAVAFLIATRWFRPMSRPGEAAAAYWRPRLKAYRAHKGEDARDLPFALAAGLGAARRRAEDPVLDDGTRHLLRQIVVQG